MFVILTKLDTDLAKEAERRRNCRQQAQDMATRSYQTRDSEPFPVVNGQSGQGIDNGIELICFCLTAVPLGLDLLITTDNGAFEVTPTTAMKPAHLTPTSCLFVSVTCDRDLCPCPCLVPGGVMSDA